MWRSTHLKTIASLIVIMALILPCYGEEPKRLWNTKLILDAELAKIKYFEDISVYFQGGLEGNEFKIGLNKDELKDFLILKYKNNFANIPYKVPKWFYFGAENILDEIGSIWARIWTMGNDPIAYHVRIKASAMKTKLGRPYENEMLGISSEEEIKQSVKKSLEVLIEHFAIYFFKARGEM